MRDRIERRPGRGDGGHADGLGAGGGRAAGERTDGARRDVQCRGHGHAGHRRSIGQAHARAAGVALSARAARRAAGCGRRCWPRGPARPAAPWPTPTPASPWIPTRRPARLRVRDAQGVGSGDARGTDRRAARARRIQPARGTGRAAPNGWPPWPGSSGRRWARCAPCSATSPGAGGSSRRCWWPRTRRLPVELNRLEDGVLVEHHAFEYAPIGDGRLARVRSPQRIVARRSRRAAALVSLTTLSAIRVKGAAQ